MLATPQGQPQQPDIPTPGDNQDNPLHPDLQMLMEQQQQQGQPQTPPPPDPLTLLHGLIVTYAQKDLNVDIQAKSILSIAQAIKLLTEANAPTAQGVPSDVQTQIAVEQAKHDMGLKTAEMRHKMQLREQELTARTEAMQQKAQMDQHKTQTDAQIKQQQAADQQAITAQNAQIQAAQAEQQMQQQAEAHSKQMAAPQPKSGGSK